MLRLLRHWWKWILAAGVILWLGWFTICLPDQLFAPPYAPALFAHDGSLLAARVARDGQWRFSQSDSVPHRFQSAIITFEDRHFYDHWGVHWPSIGRALWQNISSGKLVSGGSTISMQTIRLSRNNPKRTYFEKLTEMFRAMRLEIRFSKEEILNMYAAHAPMGGNVVGLEAASWRYFACAPHDLTWAQAATLAVLPNSPALIHPGRNRSALQSKRNRLLDQLYAQGVIDSLTLVVSKEEAIPNAPEALPQQAMHLMNELTIEHGSLRFESTIDKPLQQRAQDLLNLYMTQLSANKVNNAAALIIETNSGKTRAYVGNSESAPSHRDVNIVPALRSPGSALKPFLYVAMLDEGLMTPKELTRDIPVNLSGFAPQNYDKTYHGLVHADEALARSLNVPAVLELREYGVAPFKNRLKDFGFNHLLRSADHYGLSLILGGGEVNLLELASGYRHLGKLVLDFHENNGEQGPFAGVSILRDDTLVVNNPACTAGSAWACLEALRNVHRPESEAGWDQMNTALPISWKTGTSFGFRDAWAIGVTADYVVAVWVGNADGVGRPGVIGAQAAAPLMFNLFDLLSIQNKFQPPHDDLSEASICLTSGMRASRHCNDTLTQLIPEKSLAADACHYHRQIFIDPQTGLQVDRSCSHEPLDTNWFCLSPIEAWFYQQSHPNYQALPAWDERCTSHHVDQSLAIIYPVTQSEVQLAKGLDGKIQPIVFEAVAHEDKTLHWHLDGQYLGATQSIHQMEGFPMAGSHVLMILDENGNSDVMSFECRLPR